VAILNEPDTLIATLSSHVGVREEAPPAPTEEEAEAAAAAEAVPPAEGEVPAEEQPSQITGQPPVRAASTKPA
jgi:hypothetical protein